MGVNCDKEQAFKRAGPLTRVTSRILRALLGERS